MKTICVFTLKNKFKESLATNLSLVNHGCHGYQFYCRTLLCSLPYNYNGQHQYTIQRYCTSLYDPDTCLKVKGVNVRMKTNKL